MKTVQEYIESQPEEVTLLLEKIRATIKEIAPQAEETINYGIPTFKLNGNLVHFAGFKNHIGFYPGPEAIEIFKAEISSYKSSKGAIQFQLNSPFPFDLIKKITVFRVQQNLKKK